MHVYLVVQVNNMNSHIIVVYFNDNIRICIEIKFEWEILEVVKVGENIIFDDLKE